MHFLKRNFKMESITSFVSSRGLMKSCNAQNKNPVSSSDFIDLDILDAHKSGGSIYICTDALLNFSGNFLTKIQHPFKLVTGDSDTPINNNLIQHESIRNILENQYLEKWYAQNMIADHPKLHQIPIGMDYHTMWERPGTWGLIQQSPLAQERALLNTFFNSPDLSERLFAGYCNWHFAIDRGDRRECLEKIDKQISLIEKNHLSRISTWQRQAECMFVISPEGAGMDCHRTWEALLLGSIPVLKRSPLTKIFENLPVVILDNWGDFNSTNMIAVLNKFQTEKFDFSSLFLMHWINLIDKNKDSSILPKMTMREFKKFICNHSF
jgi:hypothetical protein